VLFFIFSIGKLQLQAGSEVSEYYKIKKELKYEGSDTKFFRKNVKDEMLKRRLEVERI